MSVASRLLEMLAGAAERKAPQAVERRVAPLAVPRRALPAPPRVLALPAPKPRELPPLAAKPRGGQFYPDANLAARDAQAAGYKVRDRGAHAPSATRYQVVRPTGAGGPGSGTPAEAWAKANARYQYSLGGNTNRSPEAAAREARLSAGIVDYTPDQSDIATPLGGWLEKALAKYLKTDFGAPNDPLRDLAARGMHYDPEMTPERWYQTVNDSLQEDPIGYYTVPRHESAIRAEHSPPTFSNDFAGDIADTAHQLAPGLSYLGAGDPVAQGALMQAAPWLRKQPVTEPLYGVRPEFDLSHFGDEMKNAMSGQLPPELAVRPESLQRMSFPQAVEHVGKINQYRVRQMEAEQAAQLNNPAIHSFKDYPDDPNGMRWVQLKAPDAAGPPPEGWEDMGSGLWRDPNATGAPGSPRYRESHPGDPAYALQEALRNEGDTMGHCVGGYCDDVMAGRSSIYSLRDAKGMPHVTIETAPGNLRSIAPRNEIYAQARALADAGDTRLVQDIEGELLNKWASENGIQNPQNIVQIKGKQNRAPNPEYLPYVQDFVKSGKWGDIGDLRNAQMSYLPDRRLIAHSDLDKIASSPQALEMFKGDADAAQKSLSPWNLNTFSPEDWAQTKHLFEGYARGGRVGRGGCGCTACQNADLMVRRA